MTGFEVAWIINTNAGLHVLLLLNSSQLPHEEPVFPHLLPKGGFFFTPALNVLPKD